MKQLMNKADHNPTLRKRHSLTAAALCLCLCACGSDAAEDEGEAAPTFASVDDLMIEPDCQGIDFNDIVYSPGGGALPNDCEPYDGTTNNPYAVRCIDAWPWYETDYPGDELCILPPPPDMGIQLGAHPQGKAWFEQVSQGDMSGYDDPAQEWTLEAGGEEEVNYFTSFETPGGRYYRSYFRMRSGSHHMIVTTQEKPDEDYWGPGGDITTVIGGGYLPGGQRVDGNTPQTQDKPDEDLGLYNEMPENPGVTYNMHHFNSTDGAILKETWSNIWWEQGETTLKSEGITGLSLDQVVRLSVEPNTTKDLHYAIAIPESVRLLGLSGHRHAWTTNMSAWLEKPDGDLKLLYQSFDWFEAPSYRFNSQVENPEPGIGPTDGGATGLVMLEAGDTLHWNCHVEFTQERAAEVGAPMPDEIGTLVFSNAVFTAEMCLLTGSTAGLSLIGAKAHEAEVPDFATID